MKKGRFGRRGTERSESTASVTKLFPGENGADDDSAPLPVESEASPLQDQLSALESGAETIAADVESSGQAGNDLQAILQRVLPAARERFDPAVAARQPRRDLASDVEYLLAEVLDSDFEHLERNETRDLITMVINEILESPEPAPSEASAPLAPPESPPRPEDDSGSGERKSSIVEEAKEHIQPILVERIDVTAASQLPRGELARQVGELVSDILVEEKIRLNLIEQRDLITMLLNDMLGLGPLEPLLADDAVTDILVNGPKQIYVEKKGKLTLTDIV